MAHNLVHASLQLCWYPCLRLLRQEDLLCNSTDTSTDGFSVRKVLAAHTGTGPVGTDKHVADSPSAIGEDGCDTTISSVFVTDELGPEVHYLIQTSQKETPQNTTIGRIMVFGRIIRTPRVHDSLFDDHQSLQLLR